MFRCMMCDHTELRQTPRIAAVVPLFVLILAGPVGAGVAWALGRTWQESVGVLSLGVLAFLFAWATPWGKRLYWGGLTCQGCGHFSMYR